MPDWSIKIVPASSGGGAAFQPSVRGAQPGDPLQAQQDDLVSWNNTTQDPHQPWQTDSKYQPLSTAWVNAHPDLYMSDPIPAQRSSSPGYDVAKPSTFVPQPGQKPPPPAGQWTIYYFCKNHPNITSERGTIVASPPPTS
jgi:hypothetical protein